jgi:hypothetical protein
MEGATAAESRKYAQNPESGSPAKGVEALASLLLHMHEHGIITRLCRHTTLESLEVVGDCGVGGGALGNLGWPWILPSTRVDRL